MKMNRSVTKFYSLLFFELRLRGSILKIEGRHTALGKCFRASRTFSESARETAVPE